MFKDATLADAITSLINTCRCYQKCERACESLKYVTLADVFRCQVNVCGLKHISDGVELSLSSASTQIMTMCQSAVLDYGMMFIVLFLCHAQ